MDFVQNLFLFRKNFAKILLVIIIVSAWLLQVNLPTATYAASKFNVDYQALAKEFPFTFPNSGELQVDQALLTEHKSLPDAGPRPVRVINVAATAYTSTVAQTDSTPCITANGFNLCQHNQENVIATNMLPFGTKVKFPDIDPDKYYTVQDRMNKRYYYRVDFWMKNYTDARNFGIKTLRMEIYE